jgi:hypothetical protein
MLQDQERSEDPTDRSAGSAKPAFERAAGPVLLHVAGAVAGLDGLARSLSAGPFQRADDLGALAEGLAANPSGRAVILYPNPVMVLGARLQSGDDTATAIEDWREDTERLLQVFRRDRRKVTLVDGHAAMADLALFHRLLGSRLTVATGETEGGGVKADSTTVGLPHLIAAQALRQDEMAAPLAAELDASSLPLGPAYRVDVDRVVEEWAAGPASASDDLQEENELLLQQLHTVQEELEAHYLENRKAGERFEALEAEALQARTAAKKVRLARKSLQEEFNEARAAWTEERKSLTDRLKWTADDLAAIRRSLSWKLTAPLRRLLGLFTGGSKL